MSTFLFIDCLRFEMKDRYSVWRAGMNINQYVFQSAMSDVILY